MALTLWKRLPILPVRPPEGHKGDFGRLLVVAGSRGMGGAACLAASAALRSGAGLVTVATTAEVAPLVTSAQPCAMTLPLPAEEETGTLALGAADTILARLEGCDALALGPGLGKGPTIADLVRRLLGGVRCPTVVDADGLNALAEGIDALDRCDAPVILTPHPGEMRRLAPDAAPVTGSGRERTAAAFAARRHCVLILKGHRSVVTDGRRVFVNSTGNPGMATGGSGDVLTGIVGGLLGQKLAPFEAAVLATHLHGLAGDMAARELGQVGMIASDLIVYLPQAFRRHEARSRGPSV